MCKARCKVGVCGLVLMTSVCAAHLGECGHAYLERRVASQLHAHFDHQCVVRGEAGVLLREHHREVRRGVSEGVEHQEYGRSVAG